MTTHVIKIYTTSTCAYCKIAKDFFKASNVSFKEYDVASDKEAREEMIKKSGQLGVPVIEIDDNLIIGFDKPRINELLGL